MLEPRQHWALCVIERMELSAADPEPIELQDMISTGVASVEEMMVLGAGLQMPDQNLVLLAVGQMSDNRTAFDRLKVANSMPPTRYAGLTFAGQGRATSRPKPLNATALQMCGDTLLRLDPMPALETSHGMQSTAPQPSKLQQHAC